MQQSRKKGPFSPWMKILTEEQNKVEEKSNKVSFRTDEKQFFILFIFQDLYNKARL